LRSLVEPQDGIPLQVKYPDGHIVRRRFYLIHPIQVFRNGSDIRILHTIIPSLPKVLRENHKDGPDMSLDTVLKNHVHFNMISHTALQ